MKAIAEYFRDLAADDRYFGAEPPVPDAEMLARIAEREIARRVEARTERGNIVLRAAQTPVPAQAPAVMAAVAPTLAPADSLTQPPAATPAPASDSDISAKLQRIRAVVGAQSMQYDEDEHADPLALGDSASLGALLMEGADAEIVTQGIPEATIAEPAPDEASADAASVDIDADEIYADEIDIDEIYADDTGADDTGEDDTNTAGADVDARDAVSLYDDAGVDDILAAFVTDDKDSETVAQAQDAQPDVAQFDVEQPDVEQPDVEQADVEQPDGAQPDADVFGDLQLDFKQDAFEDTTEDFEDGFAHDAAISPVAEDMFVADPIGDLPGDAPLVGTQVPETRVADIEEDDVAALLDRLAWLGDAPAAAIAAPAPAHAPEPAPEPAEMALAPETVADAAPVQPPLRARVIKVKRADLEAAIARGQLEPDDEPEDAIEDEDDRLIDLAAFDTDSADTGWNDGVQSSLSAEEEAALRSELAEVEAELAGASQDADSDIADLAMNDTDMPDLAAFDDAEDMADDYEDEDDDQDDDLGLADDSTDEDDHDPVESIFADLVDDTPDPQQRRVARDTLVTPSTDRDVTRLMAKTISEMDEPESASRRSAIAHLRAAVAATRADKAAGAPRREDTISDAFRADLAQVVRPRRPRADGGATARPVEPARPAPLKLVAEQRIDTVLAPAAPVRPRRISVSQTREIAVDEAPATPELAAGFADYVAETGASGLPQILEAAAAYLAFVEGRGEFSRPLLMTRARAAIGDDFNREDGLRSFGQLLRQGKIQKIKGGRFTVSQEIGFQPTERRAG